MMKKLLVISALTLISTALARAEDKCQSTEHGVPHSIKGKDYVCDKCVVLSCDTSGPKIGQCARTTKYTDCVEAAKPNTKK